MAPALSGLDGVSFDTKADPLRVDLEQATGLPFKPNHYKVWRNYKRVIECSLLATEFNDSLRVSDFTRQIVQNGNIQTADDYLSLHFSRFRYPFPAFQIDDGLTDLVFPFCVLLKYLLANLSGENTVLLTPERVGAYLIGNNCTGFEELDFYKTLPPTDHQLVGDEFRQVREMLIFASQFSALKWHNGGLLLDLTRADEATVLILQQLMNPVLTRRSQLKPENFLAISQLSISQPSQISIPSREAVTDELFTEGKRTRTTHLKIERSPLLRKYFLTKNPKPICDMCDVNMRHRYPWTTYLLEVHHLLPLSSGLVSELSGTSLRDVVGLCPNCHRSVHSFYKLWLDENVLDDFRSHQEAREIYSLAKNSLVL